MNVMNKIIHVTEMINQYMDQVIVFFFDYFKLYVCANSPHTFDYLRSFEARVNLFAGVFWAGVIGIVSGSVVVIGTHSDEIPSVWLRPGISLIAVSLFFAGMFGQRLVRVRRLEVIYHFLAYLNLRDAKNTMARQANPGNFDGRLP